MGSSGSKGSLLIEKYNNLDKSFKELDEKNKNLTEEKINFENEKKNTLDNLKTLTVSFNNLKKKIMKQNYSLKIYNLNIMNY